MKKYSTTKYASIFIAICFFAGISGNDYYKCFDVYPVDKSMGNVSYRLTNGLVCLCNYDKERDGHGEAMWTYGGRRIGQWKWQSRGDSLGLRFYGGHASFTVDLVWTEDSYRGMARFSPNPIDGMQSDSSGVVFRPRS